MVQVNNDIQCNLNINLALSISLTVLDSIIAIIAIFGNSLIIFTIRKFRHLRTATNMFVVAIAFSDILTALTVPFYVSFYFYVPYACSGTECKVRYFLTMFSTLWSLLLMIGLAIDRYIAVLKPLRYSTIVTKVRVKRCIWFSALYMAIICAVPFTTDLDSDKKIDECDLYYIVDVWYAGFGVCSHVLLTIAVTSVLYGKIYVEALLHQRKTPNAFHKRWETNMTIMMMLILGVHIIALLPYLVVVMLRYCFESEDDIQDTLSVVKKGTTVLYFAKSIANPFICALRNKGFRLAFRNILGYGRNVPKNDFSVQVSNIGGTRLPQESFKPKSSEIM